MKISKKKWKGFLSQARALLCSSLEKQLFSKFPSVHVSLNKANAKTRASKLLHEWLLLQAFPALMVEIMMYTFRHLIEIFAWDLIQWMLFREAQWRLFLLSFAWQKHSCEKRTWLCSGQEWGEVEEKKSFYHSFHRFLLRAFIKTTKREMKNPCECLYE